MEQTILLVIAPIGFLAITTFGILARKMHIKALTKQCQDCTKKDSCLDYLGGNDWTEYFKPGILRNRPATYCQKKTTK